MVHLASRDSLNVVLATAALAWNLLQVQNLRLHEDLLNQNLWEWGQTICGLTSPPGGSRIKPSKF